jgi:hypothetical protein
VKHEHIEPCRTAKDDVIIVGTASWATNGEKSVKYGWRDIRGRIARGGEVPIEALPQMLEAAIAHGGLKVGPHEEDEPKP